jgi:dCMP deaminase
MDMIIDDKFYAAVDKFFRSDTKKVEELFEQAFEDKIITPNFPTYAHTVISGLYKMKDTWTEVIRSAKRAMRESDTFSGDGHTLDKLLLGMFFLYVEDAAKTNLGKEKECCDMGGADGRDREAFGYTVDEPPVKSWDEYFFNVAKQAARNSKCFSRRIGAILVKDSSIISTGYNGPPRGIPTCDMRWKIDAPFIEKYGNDIKEDTETKGKCPRYVLGAKSGEKMHLCPAGHAEENTILNCARLGISTKDTTMYMTCGMPCSKCWVKIINAGVKEIVITSYAIYDESTKFLMDNSNVKVRLFDFLM